MSQAESSGWLNRLIEFWLAQSRDSASQLTASWVMATLVLGVGICWYICLALLSPFQGCWALHQLVPYSWYLDMSGQSYWSFGPKYVHANCCEGPHFLGRIGSLLVSGRQPICQCGVLRYTPREWRFFQRGSSWCEFAGSGHNRSSIWLWNLPLWFDPHQRHQVPFWWGNCYLVFISWLSSWISPSSRVSRISPPPGSPPGFPPWSPPWSPPGLPPLPDPQLSPPSGFELFPLLRKPPWRSCLMLSQIPPAGAPTPENTVGLVDRVMVLVRVVVAAIWAIVPIRDVGCWLEGILGLSKWEGRSAARSVMVESNFSTWSTVGMEMSSGSGSGVLSTWLLNWKLMPSSGSLVSSIGPHWLLSQLLSSL